MRERSRVWRRSAEAKLAKGYAVAHALDGSVLFSSRPVISRQLYQIKSVSQAPGQTYTRVELMEPLKTVPATMTFRPDGARHGLTHGRHELHGNALPVLATGNPYRVDVPSITYIATSVFKGGHCYVPGTLIDAAPLINELEVRLQAAGGGFQEWPMGGQYWCSQTVRCTAFSNRGGMRKHFAVWADYPDRPVGINRMLNTGVGTAASSTNYLGYSYFLWDGLMLYGNRAEQLYGVGMHIWQMGGDETVIHSGVMRNFGDIGSAGYGGSLGDSLAPRQNILIEDTYGAFSDSDRLDMKARPGFEENKDIHIVRPTCHYWGMGDTGTNLSGEIRPGAISITTYAGSTVCSIPLSLLPADCIDDELIVALALSFDGINPNGSWPITSVDGAIYFDTGQRPTTGGVTGGGTGVRLRLSSGMRRLAANDIRTEAGGTLCSVSRSLVPLASVGSRITFRTAASGDGVNPQGSWRVTATDSTRVYFDTEQTPTVGGVSIGGSNISYFAPNISPGDCAIDLRGENCSITGGIGRGDHWARSCWRTRAGESNNCVIKDCFGEDTTEEWIGGTSSGGRGAFISIGGTNCTVSGFKFTSLAGEPAVGIGPTAVNTKVCGDFTIKGSFVGIIDAGKNSEIHHGTFIDPRDEGVRVHGRELRTAELLADPPFTPAGIGSAVVIVEEDEPHGLTTGDTVSFTGGTSMSGSGLTVQRSNIEDSYPVTVLSPTTYSIVATGSATSTTPFGEGEMYAFHGPNPNTAENSKIHDLTFTFSDADTKCAPVVIGRSPGFANGRARNCRVWDVDTVGPDGQPIDLDVVDYGENTTWGPGNVGIFNQPTGVTKAKTWQLVREFEVDEANPYLDVTMLRYYPKVRVEGFAIDHDQTSNIGLTVSADNGVTQLTTGCYARIGDTGGTAGVVLAGSTTAGTKVMFAVELSNFNEEKPTFFSVGGGAEGAASAGTVQGAVTKGDAESVALNALRIDPVGSFLPGTVFRVWQQGA